MKLALAAVAMSLAIAVFASASGATPTTPVLFAADRAPTVSGEVYRLDPNGHRVNLSNSPYEDSTPVVSSDGKRVAFIRDLLSHARVYEVGIHGGRAVPVGPLLPRPALSGCEPTLAWQPGTHRLAVGVCGDTKSPLWIVTPHKTKFVSQAGFQPYWSPDGRVLVGTGPSPTGNFPTDAYTAAGKPLPKLSRVLTDSAAWSPAGFVAVWGKRRLSIYDETGRTLFTMAGNLSAWPAWSHDGQLIAFATHGRLYVRTPSGEGVLLDKPLTGQHDLVWDGNDRVVVGSFATGRRTAKVIDVRTGKTSPASSRWFGELSPDGKLVILEKRVADGYAVQVARTAGGPPKTYGRVPGAWDDGGLTSSAVAVQFVGSSHSLVYASQDYEPLSNLYTVPATGGKPQRVAGVKPYAFQPAWSADHAQIAYSWSENVGLSCKGCPSQIRVANADGSGVQVVTHPGDCTYDLSPSWSPDGTTIVYWETSCNVADELFTVPATGGTPTDLNLAGSDPAWGPTKIAYVGDQGGVWTANPDGSNPTEVSSKGRAPAWSSTGTLAYLVGTTTVVVGTTQVKLPFAAVDSLAWSPDGTRFVVAARTAKNGFDDVYTVKIDGTDPVRLTTNYDASSPS